MPIFHLGQKGDFSAALGVGIKFRDFREDIVMGVIPRRHRVNKGLMMVQGSPRNDLRKHTKYLTFAHFSILHTTLRKSTLKMYSFTLTPYFL